MNIKEYLNGKHANKLQKALSDDEAALLGVPVPLLRGWYGECMNREITIAQADGLMAIHLRTFQAARSERRRQMARRAMETLQSAYQFSVINPAPARDRKNSAARKARREFTATRHDLMPKVFVAGRGTGPYLAIIRYLIQRPSLIAAFDAPPPKYPSLEAQALAMLVGFLRYNAVTAPSAAQLIESLRATEFAAVYQETYRLMRDLGNTGEDEIAFRDAVRRYAQFELGAIGAQPNSVTPTPPAPKTTINPNTADFLQSYEWKRVRMVVLKRDGAKCRCCGATPEMDAVMNVDHIKPRRIFPELALDPNNLQVLCGECNHGKGNWDMTDWRAIKAEVK